MKALVAGALAMLVVEAPNAFGEDTGSANFLMPGCREALTSSNDFIAGFCFGQVTGIAEVLSFASSCPACIRIPKGATRDQIVSVVVKYIEARPEKMHEPFTLLAAQALLSTWGKR
jgi:hypothetical protein